MRVPSFVVNNSSAALAPDSGRWDNGETVSHWRSMVEPDALVTIEEQFEQFSHVGARRYTFNADGSLRQFVEQRGDSLVPWRDLQLLDSPDTASLPLRISQLEFAAGVPIYAARHRTGRSEGIGRLERKSLEVHAYALRDSALRTMTRHIQKKK